MNRHWDVIVVGARVAGAATAMLLARAGLRVLCLDRTRYGSDTVSTHALMRAGVLQLHRWGLLDDVVAAGTPPVRRTVFHYGQESVAVSIKPSGGVDALYAPRRTVLDALLVDAADRAGAVIEFGATVTGLHRDDTGRVAGVVVRDPRRGSTWIARAPFVIGADGRDSLVAREVEASPVSTGRHAGAFLYGYWANLPSDGYEWFYRPGVTAGAIPPTPA
jgi:2-polyprenyl-6-methoxyphenol hydroxylase-like FAD-dependent oxidoreductase